MKEVLEMAKYYEGKMMWEEALSEYKLAHDRDDKNTHILDKIGWCQSRLGRYKDAIKTYKEIIEVEPKKAKWHYVLGYQYYSLKQWANAITCFEDAIKYYPMYLIVHYRIGYAIKEDAVKNNSKSIPKIRKALGFLNSFESIYLKLDDKQQKNNKGDYVKVLFLKGRLLTDLNDINHSIEILEKVHLLDTSNKNVVYSLAKAYFYNNQYDKVIDLYPKMPVKYYSEELKAKALSKNGNYKEALASFIKISGTRKKDYIYREISQIYIHINDLDNAYIYAKKSLEINGKNHKNIYTMGIIYYKFNILFLSRRMLLESIAVKKQVYDSKFKEAEMILLNIDSMITQGNYEEDSRDILLHLESITKKDNSTNKKGEIKRWIEDRGFGFISYQSNDYFFHINDIEKSLIGKIVEGKKVEFYFEDTSKGKKGIIVKFDY